MKLTYVFPVVTLLFILLFYIGMPGLNSAPLCSRKSCRFSGKDILAVSVISLVYAAIAFTGLGDTEAPQSFYSFSENETTLIELPEEKEISCLMYYTGLGTGDYLLEFSTDGENWVSPAEMGQNYASLFKWKYTEFTDESMRSVSAKYIRISADHAMDLGELVIFDSLGNPVEPLSCESALIDEQELVPEEPDYLNSTYFDEIYHARTAYEHLNNVYPYEVSHPPLGKLIISIGISIFGMTPFGWRFSGTLFGVLMLPVLYYFLKRLFSYSSVAACGTAVFAFDFMHFVQTRIATIDTYAVFFILLMYLFMYLYVTTESRRSLALSGIFFGIGAACKWTCLYAGAGLAVIWLLHWLDAVRRDRKQLRGFFKSCLWCLLFFVLIPALIYYVSYYAYGTASGMSGIGMFFKKDYAAIVLDNQKFMFSYHSGVNAEHPYSSRWYQWIVDARPILYYLNYFEDGTRSSFGAFLNPALCWGGLIAMGMMAYLCFFRRDKKAAFILIGYLAQLLPWVFITRTTFEYHYFASALFLLLALCYIFTVMRRSDADWKIRLYGFTALSVVLFAAFYPVLSGIRVNNSLASALLKWMPSWPF